VADYWIDAAGKDTYQQIRERAATQGIVEQPADLDMVTRTLNIQKSTDERWMAFRKQPWVSAKAGGSDSVILDAMMAECSSWESELNEAERQ